jgi:hypothetical protein
MALGIKEDTSHLNLEYGKQVQPKNKKKKKTKNDQKGPNTRTFTLHSNGTSKIQRTKECDQKKDTYVRCSALGLGFLCWLISFPS